MLLLFYYNQIFGLLAYKNIRTDSLSVCNGDFFYTSIGFLWHHRCVTHLYCKSLFIFSIHFNLPRLLWLSLFFKPLASQKAFLSHYSLLKLFTGFAIAALIAWKLTVNMVSSNTPIPAAAKIHQDMFDL